MKSDDDQPPCSSGAFMPGESYSQASKPAAVAAPETPRVVDFAWRLSERIDHAVAAMISEGGGVWFD